MLSDSEKSELSTIEYWYENVGLTGSQYTRMKNLQNKSKTLEN